MDFLGLQIALIKKFQSAVVRWRRHYWSKTFSTQFKQYIEDQHFENKKAEGEEAYIKKWSVFGAKVDPYTYRFFCHYCGHTPNIIPEDIGRSYIEPILNLPAHIATYSDKNLFPLIIGKDHVARTVVCRIYGRGLLDGDYRVADKDLKEYIGDATALILKPTQDTNQGNRVIKFEMKNGSFFSTDGNIALSKEFLLTYSRDFCLQEAVHQHPFMERLCPTSVNTIRLCLYRSVANNESIITAGVLRIGKMGSVVDNCHAGGMITGIDITSGALAKYVVDQYGNKKNVWNGMDYSKETMVVPNWSKVIEFAKYIGSRILHHRLIALDIALNAQGKPVLIEYNVELFDYSLYMYTNQEVFGPYTDEIIDYCKMMN